MLRDAAQTGNLSSESRVVATSSELLIKARGALDGNNAPARSSVLDRPCGSEVKHCQEAGMELVARRLLSSLVRTSNTHTFCDLLHALGCIPGRP